MDREEVTGALADADAAYEPFAPFAAWAAEPVAVGSWEDATSHLAAVRAAASVDDVNAVLDEVLRAAAVDTGAIEGLYPRADRGFTSSVARCSPKRRSAGSIASPAPTTPCTGC